MRPSVQRSRWGDGLARVLLLGLSGASSGGYWELLFAMVGPFTWICCLPVQHIGQGSFELTRGYVKGFGVHQASHMLC